MSIGLAFWILMLLGFVFGIWRNWDSARRLSHIAVLVLAAVLLLVLFFMSHVWAHDSAISQGQFHNRAGEWCCGEHDCFVVRGVHSVSLPAPGYRLPSGEFIHQGDTLPSPDGQFWRCHGASGKTRCFFAPPNAT